MLVDSDFSLLVVNVGHGSTCYSFVFIWKSATARDAGAPLANTVIGGLTLN
jgi:hypothetical protein